MEQNVVRITGLVKEVKASRTSPAGVIHRELCLEHRSLQFLDGKPREVRAEVIVKVTGEQLGRQVDSLRPGNRIKVEGLLAQASHRDTQQLLIHAQAIERFE
ncbi:MAG: priB [Moraxellaceae bacterium]|jgi:primosomal replication protein PriB|nr:priB [Moraxellaceae bacterium]MDF3031419.1 priB [Moraxellaceae bacterium]